MLSFKQYYTPTIGGSVETIFIVEPTMLRSTRYINCKQFSISVELLDIEDTIVKIERINKLTNDMFIMLSNVQSEESEIE